MNSPKMSMENDFKNQAGLDIEYRRVSKSAVASLICALLGLSAFLAEPLIIFPVVALAFALIAWINFRKHRDELIGKGLIYLAAPLALVCFLGALAHHIYVYRTEVPDGYRRISFAMLRDNPKKALKYSEMAPELDGEKVFLRGYVRPGDKKRNLKHFILVGDFGSCCFGGSPKISEVVAVSIDIPDKTVNYGYALRRIGGTFRFLPETALTEDKEVPQVYYHIIADHIK